MDNENLSYIWTSLDETDPFGDKQGAVKYIIAMYGLGCGEGIDYVEEYIADPNKQDRSEPVYDWPD